MNPLSLHHLTMLHANPFELIEAAAVGGFEYCGLRLVAPTVNDAVFNLFEDKTSIDKIHDALKSAGVKLLDIEAIWLQPSTDIDALIPVLEAGRRLGASKVLAVGFDVDDGRLLDNFCKLCSAAAQFEMEVALEFITYCSIGSLGQALSLIARSQQPNARLLVDALQFFRSGAQAGELAAVSADLMPYAQLCDGLAHSPASIEERRREARTDRRLPGEGELPIASLLRALPDGVPLSIEAPTLKLRDLPFNEQGKIVGEASRRFLDSLI